MSDNIPSDVFGATNPSSTGAPGGQGHANTDGANSNLFGTAMPSGTGAPGSSGGSNANGAQSVSHTADFDGAYSYGSTSATGYTQFSNQTTGFGDQAGDFTGAGNGNVIQPNDNHRPANNSWKKAGQ